MKGEQFIFFASVLAIWYHSSVSEAATWEWEERIIAKVKQNKKKERAKAPTKQNKNNQYIYWRPTPQKNYIFTRNIYVKQWFSWQPLDH